MIFSSKNSWSDMANVYDNANFSYSNGAYSPLNHMSTWFQTK
ncbi:hypothetical protein [Spiroplasma poulsonii]|nr:hypothetical protein [Spiroplasma poulsonii]